MACNNLFTLNDKLFIIKQKTIYLGGVLSLSSLVDSAQERSLSVQTTRNQGSFWGKWSVELDPKTKTTLKAAAIATGLIVGGGLIMAALLFSGGIALGAVGGLILGCSAIAGGMFIAETLNSDIPDKFIRERDAQEAAGVGDPSYVQNFFAIGEPGGHHRPMLKHVIDSLKNYERQLLESNPVFSGVIEDLEGAHGRLKRMEEAKRDGNLDKFLDAETDSIVEGVQRGQNQLISFQSKAHGMGLYLSARQEDPGYIYLSLYNSGRGLPEYHESVIIDRSNNDQIRYAGDRDVFRDADGQNTQREDRFRVVLEEGKRKLYLKNDRGAEQCVVDDARLKFDTEYMARMPVAEFIRNRELIRSFMSDRGSGDPASIYEKLQPGLRDGRFERISSERKRELGMEVRRQSRQRNGNCSLEWINAFVKQRAMSESDYYKARSVEANRIADADSNVGFKEKIEQKRSKKATKAGLV